MMIKESWTEAQVLSFPKESDNIERKGGQKVKDSDFQTVLAKALSALSNTNGGHIFLGVTDKGAIDGVDPEYNDQMRFDEWLDRIIPGLVVPELFQFRTHVAEAAESSQIPNEKIVIVIDVAASDFAPHQSTKDFTYYYRPGRQSKPAPHRYIEGLFGRQKFPGPKVASAWFQSVINPLISNLRDEKNKIEREAWGFEISKKKSSGSLFNLLDHCNSPNDEQFLDHYREIKINLKEHDDAIERFFSLLRGMHHQMCQKTLAFGIYESLTSLENLLQLKDKEKSSYSGTFYDCESRTQYIGKLFANDDPSYNTEVLVQCMVNEPPEFTRFNFYPLWDFFRQELIAFRDRNFGEEILLIRKEATNLLDIVEKLLSSVETERKILSNKYGIPYEEIPQNAVQRSHRQPWITL